MDSVHLQIAVKNVRNKCECKYFTFGVQELLEKHVKLLGCLEVITLPYTFHTILTCVMQFIHVQQVMVIGLNRVQFGLQPYE